MGETIMARSNFLRNLRTAAGFLSPIAQVNGIRLEENHVADVLRRATIWLTPKAVEGFDPEEFPELSADARERLSRDVGRFEEIARGVVGDPPATDEQIRDALPLFQVILAMMWPYLEGFRVYAALKRQRFPKFVRDFAVKVGEDSTGDPATWIWVIVDDEVVEHKRKALVARIPEIQGLIEEALDRAEIRLYPYLSFRSESDQRKQEGVLAR